MFKGDHPRQTVQDLVAGLVPDASEKPDDGGEQRVLDRNLDAGPTGLFSVERIGNLKAQRPNPNSGQWINRRD
jgi:hypothetical protein